MRVQILALLIFLPALILYIVKHETAPTPVVAPGLLRQDIQNEQQEIPAALGPSSSHASLEAELLRVEARLEGSCAPASLEIIPDPVPEPAAPEVVTQKEPRRDTRTPIEKVADGCDLDPQRLKELAELDPDVAWAIQRTNELFDAGISLSGYFARECVRLRDGQPSIPLADELRATIDPLPNDIYLAAELADACIRPYVLEQDLTAEQFIWVIERGGCMEELRDMIGAMAKQTMVDALQLHHAFE